MLLQPTGSIPVAGPGGLDDLSCQVVDLAVGYIQLTEGGVVGYGRVSLGIVPTAQAAGVMGGNCLRRQN